MPIFPTPVIQTGLSLLIVTHTGDVMNPIPELAPHLKQLHLSGILDCGSITLQAIHCDPTSTPAYLARPPRNWRLPYGGRQLGSPPNRPLHAKSAHRHPQMSVAIASVTAGSWAHASKPNSACQTHCLIFWRLLFLFLFNQRLAIKLHVEYISASMLQLDVCSDLWYIENATGPLQNRSSNYKRSIQWTRAD